MLYKNFFEMPLTFPQLTSADMKINSYCNFIEYIVFTTGEMEFSEFDTASGPNHQDIIDELVRRRGLYGTFIPYEITRNSVVSLLERNTEYLHYFYCLYYAIKGGNSVALNTNIFELITDVSLKNYFETEHSLVTAAAQQDTLLRNFIDAITKALKEPPGNCAEMPIQAKDGGVDIVTYKPIDDRGNQLICLTDATIGKHWKKEKAVKLKLSYWSKYIHFRVCPLTCLSIVHIADNAEFFIASNENGLVFDRARVMRYYTPKADITNTLAHWLTTLS